MPPRVKIGRGRHGRSIQGSPPKPTAEDRFILMPVTAEGRVCDGKFGLIVDGRDKWVVIKPPGARLHPDFAEIVNEAGLRRPDIDLFYGDEVATAAGSGDDDVILKPALDLALLIAYDYIGLPLFVRASALDRLGGLRPSAQTAASYDLVLRAAAAGMGIGRITQILAVHEEPRPIAAIDDRIAALRGWLGEAAPQFDIDSGLAPGTLRLQRRFTAFPDVTLAVPTRQSADDEASAEPFIINFLNSLERTDWPTDKIRVLIGDDLADDGIYSGRRWPFRVDRIVTAREPHQKFNFAAKMNRLWRLADTEHIVLMNDDLVVDSGEWLRALLTFSMEPEVGAVGARLLYPNQTVQHAGIPGGLFDLCAHAWLGQPAVAPSYQNWALVHREWSMVTGALIATRKSVLETVNGFDERFSLEFNDVDLCLRLRMLGYRVVYTPFAELFHHEKGSRGEVLPPGSELALFYQRWNEYLRQDPAYHPHLVRNRFQIAPIEGIDAWWRARSAGGIPTVLSPSITGGTCREPNWPVRNRSTEGRMDRSAELLEAITKDQIGIEIGPWFSPIVPKRDGYRSLVLDLFDADTLRELARRDKGIAESAIPNIEEVDLRGPATNLAAMVAERGLTGQVDYIISSHNFEHVPDPVRFLQACERVLKPGGVLSMAIPDRRTSFDYFRPHSTTGEFLEAFWERRDRPTPGQIFTYEALHAKNDIDGVERIGWSLTSDPSTIRFVGNFANAFSRGTAAASNRDYVDVHCWAFTPASFELIITDLQTLGVLRMRLAKLVGPNGHEFYARLINEASEFQPASSADFMRRRTELLHRVHDEAGANSVACVGLNLRVAELAAAVRPPDADPSLGNPDTRPSGGGPGLGNAAD
jgi:GT2 family glycosyltransferase/SAM-dependent methyltransferase